MLLGRLALVRLTSNPSRDLQRQETRPPYRPRAPSNRQRKGPPLSLGFSRHEHPPSPLGAADNQGEGSPCLKTRNPAMSGSWGLWNIWTKCNGFRAFVRVGVGRWVVAPGLVKSYRP